MTHLRLKLAIAVIVLALIGVFVYSQVKAADIIDSYSESNQDQNQNIMGIGGAIASVGQSFTGDGKTLSSVQLYLKKSGSPTANTVVKIYAETHATAFGTDSKPTGTALATSDVFDPSTLTTNYQLITFTFSGAEQITLTNGSYYVLTIEPDALGPGNFITVGQDTSSPTATGNESYFSSPNWNAQSTVDVIFYVYGNNNQPPRLPTVQIQSRVSVPNGRMIIR